MIFFIKSCLICAVVVVITFRASSLRRIGTIIATASSATQAVIAHALAVRELQRGARINTLQ